MKIRVFIVMAMKEMVMMMIKMKEMLMMMIKMKEINKRKGVKEMTEMTND